MKEFQNKDKVKGKMYSKYILFVLLILIVLVIKGLISITSKKIDSREEMKAVEAKKAELQERYDNLSSRVEELKTTQGIEKEIRSKYDVVKPGESVIMVVDKEIPEPEQAETSVIKKLWNDVVGVFKKKS